MKRRTFFKACAGALAGVAGWLALKQEQAGGIVTEDDYKSLSSGYAIGDADNSMFQIYASPEIQEIMRLRAAGYESMIAMGPKDNMIFTHPDHAPLMSVYEDGHWTMPEEITFT